MGAMKTPTSAAGRSVQDYVSEEELRKALVSVNPQQVDPPVPSNDWQLPVEDPEAEEQTVEGEIQRLLTLKSYLVLDADKEEAFDELTREACNVFGVPTSLISLVDLGRQFLFSNTGNPGDVRETSRSLAFCSHTILNKNGVLVVEDTEKDNRFMNSKLVKEEPHLRFYAGAPLISPEGYKLGTFCVEGPEPRPEGLSEEEKAKLKEFAAKAMALMVERRKNMQRKLSGSPDHDVLRHAGVATNLGVALLHSRECLTAMKLFQESVQTLMYVEGDSQTGLPSNERQVQMSQLLRLLSTGNLNEEAREVLVEGVKAMYPALPGTQVSSMFCGPGSDRQHEYCVDISIPGLFPPDSKLKSGSGRSPLPSLVFAEPFRINLDSLPDDNSIDFEEFTIPLYQCSKATMFNMGLIHYHWGSPDSAVQFFDLAASLSHRAPHMDPLAFDPVVLGCLNNIAQINLQYMRPNDAMEMLCDALARGNAALATLYAHGAQPLSPTSSCPSPAYEEHPDSPYDIKRTWRLRRKLSRTLLNMGHVHFFNCNFDAALASCRDAMRLMHTNMDDPEVAAIWYNVGMLDYHKGEKRKSLEHLEKFLDRAQHLQGPDDLQVAHGLHSQGRVLFELGDLYNCLNPLNEALRIRKMKLGEQHPLVAETLFIMGKAYLGREEFDYAISAYKLCLHIQRQMVEDNQQSFDLAQTLLDIGRAHHSQRHYTEALEAYREVAELTKKYFGERHAFVGRVESIIGQICLESGSIDESVAAFKEATEIRVEQGMPMDTTRSNNAVHRPQENSHFAAPA